MQKKLLRKAAKYAKQHHRRRIWRKIVRAMACVVVFCTTYAMILPAITMEQMPCDLEEHTHGESCYKKVESEGAEILACSYDSLGVHVHTSACYDGENQLICAQADYLIHAHNDDCMDENGTVVCQLPEVSAHEHSDACYRAAENDPAETQETTEQELICTEPAAQVHIHSEDCFVAAATEEDPLTCTISEDETHTHGATCYGDWELICGKEEHTHDLYCMNDPDADVETEAAWTAAFAGIDLTGAWDEDLLAIARSQLGYQESTRNYEVMEDGETIKGYTRYGDWYGMPYGDWCAMFISFCLNYADIPRDAIPYEASCPDWIEALQDAEYDLYRPAGEYTPVPGDLIFFDWEEDGISDHTGIVAEMIPATEDAPAVVKTIEGDCDDQVAEREYDMDDAVILGYAKLPEKSSAYDCGLQEHTHEEACWDENSELVCGLEEHTHSVECSTLTEEEWGRVQSVIAAIDAMPSAAEIDAKIAEFEEAEDYEGEEAWLAEVYQQVAYVYSQYSALTEEEKAQVTNADKLLELEYIWSVTTYAADYTTKVHWVDYYNFSEGREVSKETSTVVFVNEPVDSFGYYYWTGFVIEREGAHFRVKEVLPYETNKTGRTPSGTGYIVMIFSNVSSKAAVGDYVAFKDFYPDHHYGLSVSGYGSVTFSKSKMVASQAPVVENYASTSAFVNLNLYDYHGDINTNGYTDINSRFLAGYTAYPGFQWNGGAYPYRYRKDAGLAVENPERDWIASRYYVETLDFGNSYITDYGLDAYFLSDFELPVDSTWYKGYKTDGNVSVAKSNPGDDLINGIIFGEIDGQQSNTDHPIGVSTKYEAIGKMLAYDVNGYYPKLGYAATSHGDSLRYLFDATHPGHFAEKKNTQNIDGLFQKNEETGEYYYDSRENHAQFNTATSKFVLYKQVITPNYILYPFGNFLPLNDITDPESATQVSAFDYQGGVKSYFESVMLEIQSKANLTNSEIQLYRMLLSYRYNWENWANPKRNDGRKWPSVTAADTLNDYFDNSSEFGDEGADFYRTDLQNLLTKLYNIDYNIPKNFFFGMDMSMHFMQPKDGLTGNDTNKDGTPDYPMVFYFGGDDDVWAYIDNILFLDLTGIHRHVGGKIDFVNGIVYYYAMDSYIHGAIEDTPYFSMTFADILMKHGGIAEADLGKYLKKDSSGNYTTFLDYTTHTFNFYYMERGSGSSVCRINFNFPMLRKNSITVTKENTNVNPDGSASATQSLGNPDYYFNIVTIGNDLFVGPNSVTGVSNYKVMDSAGNVLKNADGTDKVFSTDQYGIFTLKAGQSAVFEGINENAGQFYVQELIKADDNDQYHSVRINVTEDTTYGGVSYTTGSMAPTRYNKLVDWQYRKYFSGVENPNEANPDYNGPYGYQWYGRSGYNTDASKQSSFYFEQQNRLDTTKLGQLSIQKKVEQFTNSDRELTDYRIYVLLDAIPLPDGMKLTATAADGTTTREVTVSHETVNGETVSYVDILEGETVVIPNIISGTQFKIWESDQSSAGYQVDYRQTGADSVVYDGTCISGIVRVNAHVAVTITNAENGTQLEVPVTKRFRNFELGTYSYTFTLTETDKDGVKLDGGVSLERTQEFSADNTSFNFDPITYLKYSYETLPATHYYLIQETADNNHQQFLVEVTVSEDDNSTAAPKGILAEITKVFEMKDKQWTEVTDKTIAFLNTLTGDLSLEKQLNGTNNGQEFGFIIQLDPGASGVDPLSETYEATFYNDDGTTVGVTLNFAGGDTTVVMMHGEKVVIHGIPLGVRWTITEGTVVREEDGSYRITETPPSGYIISSTVSGTVTDDNISVGNITAGGTEVIFTNSSTYTLPETGGTGTISYTMAGLVLMLLSMAYLLYKNQARRREEF